MPAQDLKGVLRSLDILVHSGIKKTTLGIQKLENDDEKDEETGEGPLKHGAELSCRAEGRREGGTDPSAKKPNNGKERTGTEERGARMRTYTAGSCCDLTLTRFSLHKAPLQLNGGPRCPAVQ
ncbi:hypothetical protein Baya_2213 [Bagarius yarrelli]|uniref:Uncharacterized protein n=1 Tax=Bagarius yarrelli TaxID=175774 RepID=A0A556TNB3_BAGYA|nr:hypothetical protein Baya_2213 [Bagarius yarrelli]